MDRSLYRTKSRVPVATAVLLVAPLALAVLGPALRHVMGPFYIGFFDPDYAYLFNAVKLLNGGAPSHTDHPGTTLHILGAAVVAVAWAARAPFTHLGNEAAVLADPEYFLRCLNVAIGLIVGGAAYFFGRRLLAATGSLLVAIVGQLSIFLSHAAMSALSEAKPEPLILGVALLLGGLLVPLGFDDAPVRRPERAALPIGITLAFVTVLKLTAAPLLATLLLLPGRRAKAIAAAAFALGVLVFTLPIARHYGRLGDWFLEVLSGKGFPGGAGTAHAQLATILANVPSLAEGAPELFRCLALAVLVLLVALLWRRDAASNAPGPARGAKLRGLLGVCILVMGAQILLVARHPHPQPRYLIPAIGLVGLANAAMVETVRRLVPRLAPLAGALAALPVAIIGLPQGLAGIRGEAALYRAVRDADVPFMERVARSGCTRIDLYGVASKEFALAFGNFWAGSPYSAILARVYPGYLFYDSGADTFQRFAGMVDRGAIAARLGRGECFYMVGSPLSRFAGQAIQSYPLALVEQTDEGADSQAAYRLLGVPAARTAATP